MLQKKHKPEEIVAKLRQVDVLVSQGQSVTKAERDLISAVGAKTAYTEPDSPWENGYCESFNAKLRDEFLNGEVFYSLAEAKTVIESWRRHYNTKRPHLSLGYRPPAPEVISCPASPPGPASPATLAVAPRPVMH